MEPRYSSVRVLVRTVNPLVLVCAVRQALRQARVEAREIARFTDEALSSDDPVAIRHVCHRWVDTSRPDSPDGGFTNRP